MTVRFLDEPNAINNIWFRETAKCYPLWFLLKFKDNLEAISKERNYAFVSG